MVYTQGTRYPPSTPSQVEEVGKVAKFFHGRQFPGSAVELACADKTWHKNAFISIYIYVYIHVYLYICISVSRYIYIYLHSDIDLWIYIYIYIIYSVHMTIYNIHIYMRMCWSRKLGKVCWLPIPPGARSPVAVSFAHSHCRAPDPFKALRA